MITLDNLNYSYKTQKSAQDRLIFQARLLQAVNDSIVVAESDGRISYWNKGSERLFGWSEEEIVGSSFQVLFDHAQVEDITIFVNEVNQGYWEGKIPIITKSGQKKYAQVSVSAMYDKFNKPSYLVGVFSDITELIESKIQAEEALRSKAEFLANVSHEIRTPMTSILGYVELLRNSQLNDKQKHYLQSIKDNADQLLELINDILDLSKIEANKMILDESKFNLKELISTVIRIFEPTINDKGLTIVTYYDKDLPVEIIADRVRIKQILSNLISNAVKFTEEGQIEIKISKGSSLEKDKFSLVIEVSDTGIGIPLTKIKDIFEPFVQADSSTTRKFGGTGLGLAICKKLVNLLGGDISVESHVGKGSKFKFMIPVKAYDITNKGDLILTKNQTQKKHKLLLITNSDDFFHNLAEFLSTSDMELLWTRNYNRINSIISFYEPEIVVIDLLGNHKDLDINNLNIKSLDYMINFYCLCEKNYDMLLNNKYLNIKQVDSYQELLNCLGNFSFNIGEIKENSNIKILLIDENPVSLMLMERTLNNNNYIVKAVSKLEELFNIKQGDRYDVVIVDATMLSKYYKEIADTLHIINYKSLIAVIDSDSSFTDQMVDDYLRKPITTNSLLALVHKYTRRII